MPFLPTAACAPLGTYQQFSCPGDQARITDLLLVPNAYYSTLVAALVAAVDQTANDTAYSAAIAAGAVAINNVRGSIEASAQQTDGFGKALQLLSGIETTIECMTNNVQGNESFFEGLNRRPGYYVVFARLGAGKMVDLRVAGTFACTLSVSTSLNDQMMVKINHKVSTLGFPTIRGDASALFTLTDTTQVLTASAPTTATSITKPATGNITVTLTRTSGLTGLTALVAIVGTWPTGITLGTISGATTNSLTVPVVVAAGAATGVGIALPISVTVNGVTTNENLIVTIV